MILVKVLFHVYMQYKLPSKVFCVNNGVCTVHTHTQYAHTVHTYTVCTVHTHTMQYSAQYILPPKYSLVNNGVGDIWEAFVVD